MDAVTSTLIAWGPPGIFLVISMAVNKRLFDLYTQVQDKRIEDAGAYRVALLDVTNQLRVMSEIVKSLGEK